MGMIIKYQLPNDFLLSSSIVRSAIPNKNNENFIKIHCPNVHGMGALATKEILGDGACEDT